MAMPWEKSYGAPAAGAPKLPWQKNYSANATGAKPQTTDETPTPVEVPLQDQVPAPMTDGQRALATAESAAAPEPSWLSRAMTSVKEDPIVQMWTDGLSKLVRGAPEAALAVANNTAGAGIAGLTAPMVGTDADDQANYIRDFTENNSYTPHGDAAREVLGGLGEAFQPLENVKHGLGDTIMEATNSPALATAGYMAPDLAGVMLGPKAKVEGPAADLTAPGANLAGGKVPPPRTAPKLDENDPVGRARAADIKLLPSDIERVTGKKPGLGDRIAESLAPDDVRREMTIDNQGKQNQLGREKLGVEDGKRLTRGNLNEVSEPHYQTYRDVEQAVNVVPPSEDYLFALDDGQRTAGFKPTDAPSVTEVISSLRTKARKKLANADSKIEAEGQSFMDKADALEGALGTRLEELGDAKLLGEYQSARKSLAEINDVRQSQRAGNLEGAKVNKLDKKNPGRMTGQTKLLADISEDFPDATRSSMSAAGRKKAGGDVNKENLFKSGAKKLARGAAKGLGLGDRLLVESEGFQNRLGQAANDTERSYFADYAKRTGAPTRGTIEPKAGPTDDMPFTPTSGTPSAKALRLSDELELAAEPVANPEVLPDAPDMMTADTPPAVRGDIDFQPSRLGDHLAGDLGLDIRSGTKGAIGEKELSDLLAEQGSGDLEVAPPREMEQLEMPATGKPSDRLKLTKPPGTVKGAGTPKVDYDVGDVGDHYATSPSGSATAQENGSYLQLKRIDVNANARGKGEGTAMINAMLEKADKAGLTLASDVSMTEAAAAAFKKAAKEAGRELIENDHTVNAQGRYVSKDPRVPVFEIGPARKKASGE